jgi:type II secretory pathway pseudopilin PulG
LIELLVVIAIIGILAAILLPAIQKSIIKARQTWCASNLRQIGIAFQSFSHDHASAFPQAVPIAQGGIRELALSGQPRLGDLWLKPEVFRVLSNELGNARVAFCPSVRPADARLAMLRAADATYFLGLSSSPDQPLSLVSGDNNLDPRPLSRPAASGASVSGVTAAGRPDYAWTRDRHEYRGNLLYADAHVEGHKSLALPLSRLPLGKPAPTPVSNPTVGSRAGMSSADGLADPGVVRPPTGVRLPAGTEGTWNVARRSTAPASSAPPARADGAATGNLGVQRPEVESASVPPPASTGPRRTRRALHEDIVEQSFWWLYGIALLAGIITVLTYYWRSRRGADEEDSRSVS